MAKFKRADGKEYNDERSEDNSDLRLAVQARLIADERIRERSDKREQETKPKRRKLF